MKMKQVLNPKRIGAYVDDCMGEKKQMMASELPLENEEDFVRMIYVRLYGQRKHMEYAIMPIAETPENEIEVNGFRFRDYQIYRKEL